MAKYIVSSGEISSGIILNRNDSMTVLDGGIATTTTGNSGGWLHVSSGGVASSTTINRAAFLHVSSGGTANKTTITHREGELVIFSGGITNSTTVDYGFMLVYSGGIANDTAISRGDLRVSSGGVVNSITINPDSYLAVSSGGTATDIIENGGSVDVEDGADVSFVSNTFFGLTLSYATIHSGTVANNIIVSWGALKIFSGGIANNTIISQSTLWVNSGGTANNTTINNDKSWLLVNAGGRVTSVTLNDGRFRVSSGGIANSIMCKGGFLEVSSGGVANSIMVDQIHSELYVYSGGSASFVFNPWLKLSNIHLYSGAAVTYLEKDATVYFGGWDKGVIKKADIVDSLTVESGTSLLVYSGGTVTEIMENGGYVVVEENANVSFGSNSFSGLFLASNTATIHSGTTANSTTISGGSMFVFSGGRADSTSVDNGGVIISFGGTANSTFVNSRGYLYISSGGTANNIVENGGCVEVEDGAEATFVSNTFSGLVLSNTFATIHSGTTASITTVSTNASLQIVNGIANSTTVSSAGIVYVFSGGLANSTAVFSGGNMEVSSGGTANNTTVYSSGYMRVSSGGSAAHIEAASGALLDMSVASGTYIEGTYADSAFEIKGGSATYYSVNSGNILRISSGGVASRAYVYAGGSLFVSNGGTASRTTVSNGTMSILSGGVADSTTVNGGYLHVSSGGMASNIANNGNVTVSNGASIDTVNVKNECWLYVLSGGTATNVTASSTKLCFDVAPDTFIAGTSNGSSFEIKDGMVSDYGVYQSGWLNILSGCTANNITVNLSAFMGVEGIANSVIIHGSGYVTVSSGGHVNSVTVNNYGRMYVSSGTVNYATVNGGQYCYVSVFRGTANYATVNGGSMHVSYGPANYAIVNGGSMYVSYGPTNNATVNGGYMRVFSGTADNAIINGGSMSVTGGSASNVSISKGTLRLSSCTTSDIRIYSGGIVSAQETKFTGKITIADGGVIHAGQGTVIDLDISRLAPNMGTLLNNLSLIQDDAPAFTLTVSDLQWNGTYKLAQGVTEFDNLISVKSTASQTIHMVAVDETANVDGVEYSLKLTDDSLTVTVTGGQDIPIIPITADVSDLTKQDVTLTAGFSDDAIMREYSFDNETWHVYTEPVKCTVNGTVYFLGKDERGFVNEIASYEVTNIDKVKPEAPVAFADITTITNRDVTVSATFSEDSIVQEYSQDEETWEAFTGGIMLEENGVVYFRGTDAAGNMSEIASYTVDYIDKTPPEPPTVSANIVEVTNQDVTVSATFSEDSVVKEYSLDGQNWTTYTNSIEFTKNGTVSFRAKDVAGNVSAETFYEVSNIDKDAPDKPVASADVTEITNGDVLVTATFGEDSVSKEYSLDEDNWSTYTEAVKLTANGTVYFRGIDEAGNVSEIEIYEVKNIDKTPPVKPTASADITAPTNRTVTVMAEFSDDSEIKEYSLDETTWSAYAEPIVFDKNGSVFFRGADAAGNPSDVETYTVNNIDTTAPEKPTVSASTTAPTNQAVIVTATFSGDTDKKEYSLDMQNWLEYSNGVTMTENDIVYFRGTDAAGNASEIESYEIKNIDTVEPEKPTATADIAVPTFGIVTVSAEFSVDSVKQEYSLDYGETWQDYSAAIEFTENGTVLFRGTDVAGNTSDVTTYEVTNIETVIPDTTKPTVSNAKANITEPTNKDVTVTADFADDTDLAQSLYRIGGTNEWMDYTADGVTVTENANVFFKAVDAAGNESEVVSYTVSNIDRDAPSTPTGLMAVVSDPTVVLIWSPSTDASSGIKEYVVKYSSNGQTFTASVNNTNHVLTGLASGSWSWSVQAVDLAGNESTMVAGNSFVVSGAVIIPENLVGTPEKVSWTSTGAEQYIVEYSTDNFEHVIQMVTSAPAMDLLDLSAGMYQWRVKANDDNSDWAVGAAFEAKAKSDDKPKVIQSNADGNDDLFFATPNGTWENIYYAQNVGSVNDWAGTNEIISANGKGRIQNLFFGSTDPNVLCLTDGENGDAIFVDDVYTELPESVAEHTARLYKIQEVRAGAGDDIVDMTSQRFEYVGDGLTIRGGDGNDTIWATKGDNWLFGDAGNDRIVGASKNDVIIGGIGNDRMHGGGGDDIFTFCGNWGVDNVEQLAGGSVVLWFANGSLENWNAGTLTYTDGENSVKVSGVAAEQVALKFGDDGSAQFASLTSMGAFFDATSERIFEESSKGILASL